MTPCNACDNGKCGSCVAESLQKRGYIRRARDHCGCSEKGHKNDNVEIDRPNVKGIFSKQKEDTQSVEKEIIDESI